MASQYQTEPSSVQSLLSITEQHASNYDGVNLLTQLSIGDSCDSPSTTTSIHHFVFTCQTDIKSNGNILFPLREKYENTAEHGQKLSWHVLLNYLKSQQIVKNIGIFQNFKRKQNYDDLNAQQFPFKVQQITAAEFPYGNFIGGYSWNHTPTHLKRQEIKVINMKFPLRTAASKRTFPCSGKILKNKDQFEFNVQNHEIYKKTYSKSKPNSKLKRTLRKLPIHSRTLLRSLPCLNEINCQNKYQISNLTINNTEHFKQQYLQMTQILEKFPNETNYEVQSDQTSLRKFPCEFNCKSQGLVIPFHLSNFPPKQNQVTNNKYSYTEIDPSFRNNHNNCGKEKNSKNPKICCLPSLSMTQNCQEMKYIDSEHVPQVQDAQTHVCVMENPRSLTTTENKQTPPQAVMAKKLYDGEDSVNTHLRVLADINSINNIRPNEVGYYAEKIERLQDTIVALFERIKSSLTTNHINCRYESINAAEYYYDDASNRFALTPPTSSTSVRNSERNDNEEGQSKKYDLSDLCDGQVGQIVECSEVFDTLAETVDYGVSKEQNEQTKSTKSSSILVKSEEPHSPNSLATNALDETKCTCTSHKDYENPSELLPKHNVAAAVSEKNNVEFKNCLEFDPITAIDIEKKSTGLAREIQDAVIKTSENNLSSAKSNEMTVTRLTTHEKENENIENRNNNLCCDLQIDEMKFEMNKINGVLPSSVPERSLGKHDNVIAGNEDAHYGRHSGTNTRRFSTDAFLSSDRSSHSSNSTRNYNNNPYTPRLSLNNDSSILATIVPKYSTISTHPLPDGATNRSVIGTPSINETIASRAALNSTKSSNDSNTDTLSHRRPSLGSLRSTQSTSVLSTDLPRYLPMATLNPPTQTIAVNRAISIDSSSLQDVLPERTRLRRQRRLKPLNSLDEPKDPIERLNRLKARISASLSEVKGVLKQYSTDAENDNESQTAPVAGEIKEEDKKEVPITFRFVKKIRRRSLFSEDDDDGGGDGGGGDSGENKQKDNKTNAQFSKEKTENRLEKQLEIKDETDNCKLALCESTLPTKTSEIIQVSSQKGLEKPVEENFVKPLVIEKQDLIKPSPPEKNEKELNTCLYTLKEEVQEPLEDTIIKQTESKPQPLPVAEEDSNEIGKIQKNELHTLRVETTGTIPKATVKQEADKSENDVTHETTKKTKKKIIIKSKDHSRRASLAAVEGSRIEPPVKVAVPAKIQRRPSDSEAVIKRKLIVAKTNTSGLVEEVTPKPKIVKVKKCSIENNNNLQLATTQTKLKKEDVLVTPAANYKSDDLVKSIDKDNKSIHTDKNQDVLLPKLLEQQQQQRQITRQTNSLLPTQLVIDDAASLNVKTIENSVLSQRQSQQQQQQEQQSLQQDQHATIICAATNFKSNDIQTEGAMLENITTVLSSPTDSKANGQIKRENILQQEDLHDLLQQETTIIKPAISDKQNELKRVNQNEKASNVKDIREQEVKTEKFNGCLESVQTTINEQQQKSSTQYKQAIAPADENKAKAKTEAEAKSSLKEPCIDKTTVVSEEHHKQQQPQQQQQLQQSLLAEGEQSITNIVDRKATSSLHISISSTPDITHKTTTKPLLPTETAVEKQTAAPADLQNTMPELQLTPAPVQTADRISHPEHHKKKIIIKKIVRQPPAEKTEKIELEKTKPTQQDVEPVIAETIFNTSENIKEAEQVAVDPSSNNSKTPRKPEQIIVGETLSEPERDELNEECSESTEISESSISTSTDCQEVTATQVPKKERVVKKKVIIKRQKRRLSIGDNFFHPASQEQAQHAEFETLEKAISYVTDEEYDHSGEDGEGAKSTEEQQEEKKPLKSCILHKEYNIGDEVLYAERFKKTQIKWRRGRVKERITSISYLLDIDGKDVSSHINYLKKYTGRKVSFGGKEYLEIDYEQLAEEEEKAERLQRRTFSIWNMV